MGEISWDCRHDPDRKSGSRFWKIPDPSRSDRRDREPKSPQKMRLKIGESQDFSLIYPDFCLEIGGNWPKSIPKSWGQSPKSPSFEPKVGESRDIPLLLNFRLKIRDCQDCPRVFPISLKNIWDGLGLAISTRSRPILTRFLSPSRYFAHAWSLIKIPSFVICSSPSRQQLRSWQFWLGCNFDCSSRDPQLVTT